MLAKTSRLNLKTNFNFVASGDKIRGQYFNIFFRPGDNDQVKIGVALKRENFKKAVERNKAKRLVYASFQNFYQQLPQKINIIVMPKTEILSLRTKELEVKLQEVLKKSGLL